MASLSSRLEALEKAAAGRWGEFEKPEAGQSDLETSRNDSELVASLIDVVKGLDAKMVTLAEAMNTLVRETTEMGSAIEAHLAQSQATIDLLRANAQNPEAVLQIANSLEAYQQRLASAAVVNTPAVTPDAVEPAPPIADPVTQPPSAEEAAVADAAAVVVPETPEVV